VALADDAECGIRKLEYLDIPLIAYIQVSTFR
jgi:hypothetical protein